MTEGLQVYLPRGQPTEEIGYVLQNFFCGLETIQLREYGAGGEDLERRVRPCVVVFERNQEIEGKRAEGELWVPRQEPAEFSGKKGEIARKLRDLAAAGVDKCSYDLFSLLFEAYSCSSSLPDGEDPGRGARHLFHEDSIALVPWIDRIRASVVEKLGLRPTYGEKSRTAVVALTHDVDTVHAYTTASLVYYLRNVPWVRHAAFPGCYAYARGVVGHAVRVAAALGSRSADLVRWYRAEKELGVRSTYYFLEDRAARYDLRNGWYSHKDKISVDGRVFPLRDFMTVLRREGFEVGPHVGLHAYNRKDAYSRAIEGLKDWAGPPVSARHHWCMFDLETTPAILEELGISYDLNFGGTGFDLGTCTPFRLYNRRERRPSSVIAIPTVVADDLLFKAHNYGLPADKAWEVCVRLADAVKSQRGIVAVSFHPDKYRSIDKLEFYCRLLEFLRQRGFRLTTAAEAGEAARSRFPQVILARGNSRAR